MDGIDYYVTSTFGEELYNSCKDVKFGTMNTRAIDFIGAGAKSFNGDLLCQYPLHKIAQYATSLI